MDESIAATMYGISSDRAISLSIRRTNASWLEVGCSARIWTGSHPSGAAIAIPRTIGIVSSVERLAAPDPSAGMVVFKIAANDAAVSAAVTTASV